MGAIFTEDLISTFFHGDVQMDFPGATADDLATEGIEHPRDQRNFQKRGLTALSRTCATLPRG